MSNLEARSLLVGIGIAGLIALIFGLLLSFIGYSEGIGISLFGLAVVIVALIGIAASDKIEYPWYGGSGG